MPVDITSRLPQYIKRIQIAKHIIYDEKVEQWPPTDLIK